jgi:hypothetical protein
MSYREGLLEVTSQERAVPLGQKGKRGRPKALGNCLLKSPPLTRASSCPPSPTSCPDSPPAISLTQASTTSPSLATDCSTPPLSSPTDAPASPSPEASAPAYSPARRKSRQKRIASPPKRTRRTVVSTIVRKSPVKRKAVSPVKSPRKLRPRK